MLSYKCNRVSGPESSEKRRLSLLGLSVYLLDIYAHRNICLIRRQRGSLSCALDTLQAHSQGF